MMKPLGYSLYYIQPALWIKRFTVNFTYNKVILRFGNYGTLLPKISRITTLCRRDDENIWLSGYFKSFQIIIRVFRPKHCLSEPERTETVYRPYGDPMEPIGLRLKLPTVPGPNNNNIFIWRHNGDMRASQV